MILALDFDGVIHDPRNRKPGRKMGEPVDGAVDAITRLKRQGHTIIIHTVRGNRPDHIADWLKHFGIPYDQITDVKPDAMWFIDNHGYHFVSWEQTLQDICA